jgi:protein gp37
MADVTGIEWCDATINLWIGCTRVSAACDNCYAASLGGRFGVKWDAPPVRTSNASWSKIATYQRGAARWFAKHGRPRRVFINSLSDFFDNQADPAWRAAACVEMQAAPDVIFILVTKRPQNVRKMVPVEWIRPGGWPPNVWLLTTAENQVEWNRRVAELLDVPGPAVMGVSMEPMLDLIHPGYAISFSAQERAAWASQILKRTVERDTVGRLWWVIIGGESGRRARPMPDLTEVARLTTRFRAALIAVFVKQMSAADFPATFKDFATFPNGLKQRTHP